MKEQFVLDIVKNSEGKIALDIGAHYGEYTNLLAERFDQVIAVEPCRSVAAVLFDMVKEELLHFDVTIVNKAISDHNGLTKFWFCNTNDGGGTIFEEVARARRFGHDYENYAMIKCITIDELSNGKEIDFIKMDIEGAEDFVWNGALETLKRSKNLKIVLETHKTINGPRLYDFFINLGFTISPDDGTLKEDRHYLIKR